MALRKINFGVRFLFKPLISISDFMKEKNLMKNVKALKRIIIQSNLNDLIQSLSNLKLIEIRNDINFGKYDSFLIENGIFQPIENEMKHQLNAEDGLKAMEKYPLIAAYDESINKFTALEGTAYLMSHTIVYLYEEEYIPTSLITLYFFTKARNLSLSIQDGVMISDDIGYDSKRIYVEDKVKFLKNTIIPNTILFVDGPLIGGDWYVKMISTVIEYFNPQNIIPIFIVKNSHSSLVVDNIPEFRNRYNSDMHWAYHNLDNGERSGFFIYRDKKNPRNARIFCYLKALNVGPLRVEFHPTTFERYNSSIPDILNMIYYFLLVQGDYKNPQIRPIAIAEKYARETIHLINLERIVRSAGLIPDMNQERFGWST